MTRLLVLSDSHGDTDNLRWMLEQVWKQHGRIDGYIHCGDGARDFDQVQGMILDRDPRAFLCGVRGNCDFGEDRPLTAVLPVEKTRILVTHGHAFHVKSTTRDLNDEAVRQQCSLALYGHTHTADMEIRGALLVNPGAARDGRAAMVEINGDRVNAELLEF